MTLANPQTATGMYYHAMACNTHQKVPVAYYLDSRFSSVSLAITQGPSVAMFRGRSVRDDQNLLKEQFFFGVSVICYTDDRSQRMFATRGNGYGVFVTPTKMPQVISRGVQIEGIINRVVVRSDLPDLFHSSSQTSKFEPEFSDNVEEPLGIYDGETGMYSAPIRGRSLSKIISNTPDLVRSDRNQDTCGGSIDFFGMKTELEHRKEFQYVKITDHLRAGAKITMIHRGAASEGCILSLSSCPSPAIAKNRSTARTTNTSKICHSNSANAKNTEVSQFDSNLADGENAPAQEILTPYVPDFILSGANNPFRTIDGRNMNPA